MSWGRAFLVWLLIIAIEAVHGTLRVLFLQPLVGDFRARQIAVFTGSPIIFLIAYLFTPWLRATATRVLINVGLFWVACTVAFELALGRWVLNLPWVRIFSDYNLFRGGLMLFGLAVLALSPLIAMRLRARVRQHRAA
jgi:hypothetical protein